MLLLEVGTAVTSAADKAECWRRHFSEQEAGIAITPSDYPIVFSAQSTYAQSHEVALRLSAIDTARQLLPVFMKSALGCREPTNWRGGQLIFLAKKASGKYTCDAFRSILLASIPGKAYHRTLRSRLVPALCANSTALQAGSKPGVGTDGISATARTYQEYQLEAGRLPAMVYFDLKAAYYRMLRQLVVPIGEPEERFLRWMHSLKLPPRVLDELIQHLERLSSLEPAAVNPHTIAAVSDLFRGTWFRMDRHEALTYTARGSRPGQSLADVLFAFSLSTYIKSCDQALSDSGFSSPLSALRAAPLSVQLPCQRDMSFASWADDMARLMVADSWPALTAQVEGTMQVCTEHPTACGMQFAFARHKTAVLLPAQTGKFRGRKVATGQRPVAFSIWNRVTQESHDLEVVPVYQHLGSIVTADGSPATEVAYRKAMAIGITRAHTHRFFANSSYPLDVRRNILRPLSVSKFNFGAAGLNLSAAVHRRGWCAACVDIWRRLLRRDWATHKRTHGYLVLHTAQAPSPLLALASSRAAFLRRLVLHGPPSACISYRHTGSYSLPTPGLARLFLTSPWLHSMWSLFEFSCNSGCHSMLFWMPFRAMTSGGSEPSKELAKFAFRTMIAGAINMARMLPLVVLSVADLPQYQQCTRASTLHVQQLPIPLPICNVRPLDLQPTTAPFAAICVRRTLHSANLYAHIWPKHMVV